MTRGRILIDLITGSVRYVFADGTYDELPIRVIDAREGGGRNSRLLVNMRGSFTLDEVQS